MSSIIAWTERAPVLYGARLALLPLTFCFLDVFLAGSAVAVRGRAGCARAVHGRAGASRHEQGGVHCGQYQGRHAHSREGEKLWGTLLRIHSFIHFFFVAFVSLLLSSFWPSCGFVQFLDKPWPHVSSLPPPGTCLHFYRA